jgi:biopolymer transport protein ExbB
MELFVHGGWIMWPILIVSFVAVTAVAERTIFLFRENARRQPERVAQMLEKVEHGDFDAARGIGEQSTDYVASILVYALTHRDVSLTNAFTRAANNELNRFCVATGFLDTR